MDTGSITLSLRLEHRRESADIARRAVRAVLDRGMDPELVEDAVLCTSEIVTNAIVHTDLGCELQMQFHSAAGGSLRIEVCDGAAPGPLAANPVDVHRAGGRGLQIVEEASTRWGSHAVPGGGKVVWFEIDRTDLPASVDVPA